MQQALSLFASREADSIADALQQLGYQRPSDKRKQEACDRAADIADREGVTLAKTIRTIGKGLDAKMRKTVAGECVVEEDTDAQLRAAELALRIHGVGQQQHTQAGVTVIIGPMREHIQDVVIAPRESGSQESCGSQVCEE